MFTSMSFCVVALIDYEPFAWLDLSAQWQILYVPALRVEPPAFACALDATSVWVDDHEVVRSWS